MEKPTALVGDLPSLNKLKRVLTKFYKDKFQEKREKSGKPLPYIKDKQGRVHGTPELAKSAIYPARFCNEVQRLWGQNFAEALRG